MIAHYLRLNLVQFKNRNNIHSIPMKKLSVLEFCKICKDISNLELNNTNINNLCKKHLKNKIKNTYCLEAAAFLLNLEPCLDLLLISKSNSSCLSALDATITSRSLFLTVSISGLFFAS